MCVSYRLESRRAGFQHRMIDNLMGVKPRFFPSAVCYSWHWFIPKLLPLLSHILASYGNQDYIISCSYSVRKDKDEVNLPGASVDFSHSISEDCHKSILKLSL